MTEVTRRRFLAAGAAGAGVVLLPPGTDPPKASAAGDLALRYDEPAGSEWLRALPIGNGRLGAMVFGNVDTERLQLNEDTVWAGGPYDSANPRGAAALPEIRRRVLAGEFELRDDTGDEGVRPTRLEADLVEFTGAAGHTYRASAATPPGQ